jgi:hypothetical protein
MVQSGLSGTRIADNWRATGPFELSSLQRPWRYLAPWRLPSMLTYDRLNRQLPVWGVDFDAIHRSPIEGTYNVYNFTAKAFETHEGPELTPELFNACFALPVWFPAVEIGGQTYIDGVYWKDANLTEAVRRGADEIWVIWTVSETAPYPAGPYGQYFAIIEAVADGRFYEELAQIEEVNAAVRAGIDTEHREIKVHVIRHPTPVPLDYLLFFSAGDMSRIVDMGVRDTRAYLAAAGVPFEPSGPLAPPIGMRFVETMRGWWTQGETDPEAGRAAGRRAGRTLAVKLAITIDDMDAFLADPSARRTPRASSTARLGGRLPSTAARSTSCRQLDPGGRARDALPAVVPRPRRQPLPVRRPQARPHDTPLDVWADTTTLFVKIHRGETPEDEVVGAGVIELRLLDLVRQATTFRVLHGADVVARLLAVLGFSRYFVGSLWDTYVRRR